jgi:hypothetical protein
VTWYIFGLVFYLLNEIEVCDMFLKTWSFSFWVHDFREPFVCPGPLKFWFYTLDDVSASGDGPRWWWQASSAVTAHSTCCTLKHEGNIRSVPDLKDTPERQRGTPMAFCSFTWPFCLWSNDSGGARPSNSSSPFPSWWHATVRCVRRWLHGGAEKDDKLSEWQKRYGVLVIQKLWIVLMFLTAY